MDYETVSNNERAYFDTSVWVAIMLGNVPHNAGFGFAEDKLKELKNNAFHVYVSDLVLMESVWAIQKRIAEHTQCDEDTKVAKDDLERKIKKKIECFYQAITEAQNVGMITVENPKYSLDYFLQQSHAVNGRPQDKTLSYRSTSKQYRYAGTGFLDFQHAIIASGLECARFYSVDSGFKRLKSMPEFKTLAIVTP